MSKKNPTKFNIEGMDLYRNGVHIATRVESDVLMKEDCEKFGMIAVKMLNSKKFNKENGLEPIVIKKKEADEDSLATPDVANTTHKSSKPVEESSDASPIDDGDDSDYSELDFYREQCIKLEKRLNEIEQEKKQSARFPDDFKPEPIYEEPTIMTGVQKHDFAPPQWGLTPKEGVPPCPQLGEWGTKGQEQQEWLERYYPEKVREIYGSFARKKAFLKAKEEKKAKEKILAQQERERIFG